MAKEKKSQLRFCILSTNSWNMKLKYNAILSYIDTQGKKCCHFLIN